jgi:hypothetical protein
MCRVIFKIALQRQKQGCIIVIMENFHCRGHKRRIEILKEYEIKPVAHMPLLNGQIKYSAAGNVLTREYYCFEYRKKDKNEDWNTFICGIWAANDFLKLLNMTSLPIFNILKNGNIGSNIKIDRINKSNNQQHDNWDSLALELYNIINIILMSWDTNGGILSNILIVIRENFTKRPELKNIKSVNTIISKDSKKRTIFQMIEEMSVDNDIKQFKFPLIEKVLMENNIKNNITVSNGT